MKLEDLKDGMIVELANGQKYLVWKELGAIFNKTGYMKLSSYTPDMLHEDRGDTEWDIVKVYVSDFPSPIHRLDNSNHTLVWDRYARVREAKRISKELKEAQEKVENLLKQLEKFNNG